MANFLTDNEDLQYYIEKGLDWSSLAKISEQNFSLPDGFQDTSEAVEFYKEILNLVGQFSSDQIAPRAREIDETKVKYRDGEVELSQAKREVFAGLKDLQLHGMTLPRELGGLNVPLTVYMTNNELISRADASCTSHYAFHCGIAMALLVYSIWEGTTEFSESGPIEFSKTRFAEAIQEIASGEAWGSMDITEPDAGSDMGKLRTRAEQDEDGNWTVTGQKIFITSGHGKYHVVVARTSPIDPSDPTSGLKGLSLFLVKAYSEENGKKVWHARLDGVEDKLGNKGSATVSISYNRTKAEIIGKPGDGFKYMLLIMNNARVAVGFKSLGLCEAAYRMASDYASMRPSMGKMIKDHEMIAEYLSDMKLDIQAIRALAMTASFHEEMNQKLQMQILSGRLSSSEQDLAERRCRLHKKKSRQLTPLLKYLASEKAVEHARLNIQIHGGVGYTKEFEAERLLRDALLLPIYEGTSQIQSLMATKDTLLDIIKNPKDFAKLTTIAGAASLSSLSPSRRRVASIQTQTYSVIRTLIKQIGVSKIQGVRKQPLAKWPKSILKQWDPKVDFGPALLHAERLTKILIDKAVVEILLEQSEKHPERAPILEQYLEKAEPRVQYLSKLITGTGKNLLKGLRKSPKGESPAEQHA